ncbi:TonB-dependent siderophore receptor [Marinobacterium lutimaris]|uniref:Outer-membrane receptor for ferric coprogen and ferric-rhodotorulic acid n=1 Tax=Marinobacterium lutimaris TaxID=568106 RepID=A0A1H6DNJ2_9GAMM|nr:TonB-dependent receptor [Marinobacterium lutimaris]SEG86125.1 outer-membrane receptor for ferric coprogen and ferric-rhodotorulic acid [Marinobacterium lutimaris]
MKTLPLSRKPLALAIHLLAIGSLCTFAGWTPQAQAQSGSTATTAEVETKLYKIPAGPLTAALNRFSTQAGVFLVGASTAAQGKNSPGLNGNYTLEQGFAALLTGSGLQAVKQTDGSYTLQVISTDESMLPTISVTDTATATESAESYKITSSPSATKMQMDILDTPQSVSVVTAKQIEDFQLGTINDVLDSTTGITVEKMESDRTQFTSRGFEITNFLIDGVSLPLNYSYQYGDIDMAIYDRVEVIRGATGLVSANGDPSATINLIRKRPTDESQAELKVSAGSWDYRRADADFSGALNEAGTVRGRAIFAVENADSYLDRYETDSNIASAIIETDLSDRTLLSAGFTRYEDNNQGSQWGGIPAFDGTDYDVSTNATSDWAYRDVVTNDLFVELEHTLANDWQIKGTYAYEDIDQDAELINLWVYSGVLEIDGVQQYELSSKEHLFNLTLNGDYSLWGRDHEFVAGIDLAKRDLEETSNYDYDLLGTVIDLDSWDGSTDTPTYDDRTDGTDYTEKQAALFLANNLHLTDKLSLLLGTRLSNWERSGTGYWDSDWGSDDSGVLTPYAGAVYKITDNLSTYASYTTTFTPQSYIDENGRYIDPAEGKNYEIGLKTSFLDDQMAATFALFRTEKDSVAEFAGTLTDGTGRSYYSAEDGVTTTGVELEVTGSPTDTLDITAGFAALNIEDAEGQDTQTYIPTRTLNASISYRPSVLPGLKVGASVSRRNATSISGSYGNVEQGAYTLVDLMAGYRVNDNIRLSLNVNNVTDEKYYGSLIKPYVVYGEPRSINASFTYQF